MFTAKPQKNRLAATLYFDEHLSHNDYYTLGQKQSGQWVGLGAEKLGLGEGIQVTREAFLRLCDNQHPGTGKQLTQLHLSGRRIFFDFTCSAPKSVSILAVTMEDERIVAAHQAAAAFAMKELEAFAGARVRKAGAMEDRMTGNLVGASFMHTSSRALDPQLHTHFTLFNATFDQTEARWKALQTSGMFDAIHYGTAVYRNELAKQLHRIGYQTRATAHGFEIEGVEQTLIERFSKRSQQRNTAVAAAEARLKRKLSNDEISHLVHKSRPRKLKDASEKDVRAGQLSELGFFEKRSLRQLVDHANGERKELAEVVTLDETVKHSLAHVFARQSVVPEHKILEAALVKGCGQVELPALKRALLADPELVRVGSAVSTRAILKDELRLIRAVNTRTHAATPIAPDFAVSKALGPDQKAAVRLILSSKGAVCGFRGLAGTGKTTALKELHRALQLSGKSALFCAPTAAATEVLRKDGFAAVTLAKLLQDGFPSKSVIVLDEAGAVSTADMLKLLRLAKEREARLVLSGDTGQHASVAQGDALRIIEEHSNYRFATLRQIRRQRTKEYREIVELAAEHRPGDAFQRLERSGQVIEAGIDVDGGLYKKAAAAYLAATADGKKTLIVSPTWAEIEAVTAEVRAQLRDSGRLAAKEESLSVFDPCGWTDAQKQVSKNYEPGALLRFVRKTEHFKAGEFAEVLGQVGKQLRIRTGGRERLFHPSRSPSSFDVGDKRELEVAAGDLLLLRANAPGFVNGEQVQVKSISQGRITLDGGRTLPAGYRTFTHGYAVTSHSAQSKTVDEALLVASSRSFAAVSQEQFYVSISRARDRVRIFTDDAELLSRRICASHSRKAAIELDGLRQELEKNGLGAKRVVTAAPEAPRHIQGLSRDRGQRQVRPMRPSRFHPAEHIVRLAKAFAQWVDRRFGITPGIEPQTPAIRPVRTSLREPHQENIRPLPTIRQSRGIDRGMSL